ncbi:MAG: hypothetical protein HY866_01070 [Chloroflexi bacterium]|nr:hypothetical protein [Chloroflexota bacterium]
MLFTIPATLAGANLAIRDFPSLHFDVRLKTLPVVDVISHLLMLSSLLFLAGYYAYNAEPGPAWWAAAGVGLISAYGQLYNQLRDFDLDRAAGLFNTSCFLGRQNTQRVMYVWSEQRSVWRSRWGSGCGRCG